MAIHNGLDHFKGVIKSFEQNQNKWEAWQNYYNKYKIIFDSIFSNLYMADVDKIRKDIIPHLDFYLLAEQAEKNFETITQFQVVEILKRCSEFYNFTQEYDVYLLVGFGHIDGTALSGSKPFLYLGLERLVNMNIERLIQHEFNHLVRFISISEFNHQEEITVGQLAIAEGLATLTPLVMNEMEFSEQNLQTMLFLDDQQYNLLNTNALQIEQEITTDFEKPLNPSLMAKYFMLNEDSKLGKAGYFLGMRIILALLNKGWDLRDLTKLNSKILWNEYSGIQTH